jgi:archaeal flagellin FlaB
MTKFKSDDSGFTGLEAAIVLIAFVVVAAVFSYVVLGAGFFTTQKSQETVYKGVEQATANLQMIGQVYGIASASETQIDIVQFTLGIAPGAPAMDLTKMVIVVSQPGESTIHQLQYDASSYDDAKFTVESALTTETLSPEGTVKSQQQAIIKFKVDPAIRKNGVVNIELRPAVGAALPFSKTAPASITKSQKLT